MDSNSNTRRVNDNRVFTNDNVFGLGSQYHLYFYSNSDGFGMYVSIVNSSSNKRPAGYTICTDSWYDNPTNLCNSHRQCGIRRFAFHTLDRISNTRRVNDNRVLANGNIFGLDSQYHLYFYSNSDGLWMYIIIFH